MSKKKSNKQTSNTSHRIMKASVESNTNGRKCFSCGKKAHDFEQEEALDCIPPKDVLKFGKYQIDKKYRAALYDAFPMYTSEEVVGSYIGKNPYFPSQTTWLEQND